MTAWVTRCVHSQLRFLVGLLLVGALLALTWRLLASPAAGLGDDEPAATVDGTLFLLGVVFGILTAVFVLLRPGPAPVDRTVAAIVGTVLGSVIAWQLGDRLGTPALRADGAAFSWPVTTAGAIFLGALLPWTSGRLQSASVPPPPPGRFSD
jgi:hypothetical protein